MPPGRQAHLEQEVSVTVVAWPNFMPYGGVMTGQAAATMMAMETAYRREPR